MKCEFMGWGMLGAMRIRARLDETNFAYLPTLDSLRDRPAWGSDLGGRPMCAGG